MNFFGMHRTSEKVVFLFLFSLLFPPLYSLSPPSFFLQYHVLSIEICFRVFSVNKRSNSMENTVLETAEKSSDLRFILSDDRCAPLSSSPLLVSFQLSSSPSSNSLITVWRTKKSTIRETKRKQERSINGRRRIFKALKRGGTEGLVKTYKWKDLKETFALYLEQELLDPMIRIL